MDIRTIDVQAEPASSTVEFLGARHRDAALDLAVSPASDADGGLGRLRVLVVDDDPAIRSMLVLSLSLEGLEIDTARDGAEALEIARFKRPDVILLDIMMPAFNGYDVMERVRGDHGGASPPVILLTAKADDADVWEGWSRGADSYITKPLDLDILMSEIARVTAGRCAA